MGTIDWMKKHPAATAGIAVAGYGAYKQAKYGQDWYETKHSWAVNLTMIVLFVIGCEIHPAVGGILLAIGIWNGAIGNLIACKIAEALGDEPHKQTQYKKVM